MGNIPIPDLDPNKLEVIGNGYYTDGTNTYFFSGVSEKNKKLICSNESIPICYICFSKTKKPQTIYILIKNRYWQKIKKLFQTFHLLQLMEIISIMKEKF